LICLEIGLFSQGSFIELSEDSYTGRSRGGGTGFASNTILHLTWLIGAFSYGSNAGDIAGCIYFGGFALTTVVFPALCSYGLPAVLVQVEKNIQSIIRLQYCSAIVDKLRLLRLEALIQKTISFPVDIQRWLRKR
jgi:hypothetical protein